MDDAREVALQKRDPSALSGGDIGSFARGDADICFGQCGSVIYAIARLRDDHQNGQNKIRCDVIGQALDRRSATLRVRYHGGDAREYGIGAHLVGSHDHPNIYRRLQALWSQGHPNAKVSFGYRADFFFDAVDAGFDTRHTQAVGFHGPFATVSIGPGG